MFTRKFSQTTASTTAGTDRGAGWGFLRRAAWGRRQAFQRRIRLVARPGRAAIALMNCISVVEVEIFAALDDGRPVVRVGEAFALAVRQICADVKNSICHQIA